MAEDWQVGDLALCVRDDWIRDDGVPDGPGIEHPRSGGVYTVEAVFPACGACGGAYLELAGFKPAYAQVSFRRIPPLTGEERRQAIEDMRVPSVVPFDAIEGDLVGLRSGRLSPDKLELTRPDLRGRNSFDRRNVDAGGFRVPAELFHEVRCQPDDDGCLVVGARHGEHAVVSANKFVAEIDAHFRHHLPPIESVACLRGFGRFRNPLAHL